MAKKKWWFISAGAIGALLLDYKSTFIEAFIYDGVTRTLDFLFRGYWPYIVGCFALLGIVWVVTSARSERTLWLVESANPRIGSQLELRKSIRLQRGKAIGRWLSYGVAIAMLVLVAWQSSERLRFPSLARQLTDFQKRFLVIMYIPQRWEKSDPLVANAIKTKFVKLMNEYGKPIGDEGVVYCRAREVYVTHDLVENNPDFRLFALTKKGIRFGAYLERKDQVFTENPNYRKNTT